MTTAGSVTDRITNTPEPSYSALAHTVTTDGEFPRCAECGDYGAHDECQPEALADQPAPIRR